MKTAAISDNWYDQMSKLKREFVFLMDSDLSCDEGGKETMVRRLSVILGKSKEEVLQLFESL